MRASFDVDGRYRHCHRHAYTLAGHGPPGQIWFGMGGTDTPRGHADWNRIFFEPEAKWPEMLGHVQVMTATADSLTRLTDDELAKVVQRLDGHHIALSVAVLSQNWENEPKCGNGVEGYSNPGANRAVTVADRLGARQCISISPSLPHAQAGGVLEILQFSESPPYRSRRRNDGDAGRELRQGVEGIMDRKGIHFYPRAIKGAGIDVDYVLMDEPLYFGHDYTGKDACRLPIADVAKGVAESVATIRSYHPKARFALVEPVQSLPGGVAELAEFLDAYKAAAHAYPISVELDVQWRRNWRGELPPFVNWLKARGIGYGVTYNATGGTKGDRAWIASAKENAQAVASAIHIKPHYVSIKTWEAYPSRIVPESDPDTMTGYLKWFVAHAGH